MVDSRLCTGKILLGFFDREPGNDCCEEVVVKERN